MINYIKRANFIMYGIFIIGTLAVTLDSREIGMVIYAIGLLKLGIIQLSQYIVQSCNNEIREVKTKRKN